MSLFENAPDRTLPEVSRSADDTRLLPVLSVATLFVSALLLFLIQPMFAKMVLPKLGGAPSVWSVAMVFFQAVLLAGYAYAHLLGRLFGPQRAGLVHLLLLVATAMTLPIAIAPNWGAPPADWTALWLFGLFAASIGLPFFALSASAPLLQSWFAGSGHRDASNPYVLYAASNLGSFAALFAYPVVVEPLLALNMQASIWSFGFAVLALLVAAVAFVLGRGNGAVKATPSPETSVISAADRLQWIALAAIPSGLVIAVTGYLTTDVAAAPFLWVIPLALYLFTFVVVFRDRPWISHATVVRLVPFAVAPLAISLVGAKVFWFTTIVLHLVVFALLALLCHGELYARRPHPQRLTEFFLCTSLGGVLGGAFAGLLAPQIFSGNYEYPILIALALLALPGMFAGGARQALMKASPWLAVAIALATVWYVTQLQLPASFELPFRALLVLLAAGMIFFAPAAGVIRRIGDRRLDADDVLASGHGPDRDRAQLLRGPYRGRPRGWPRAAAVPRQHDAWRRAVAQRRRHAGRGSASASELLLSGQPAGRRGCGDTQRPEQLRTGCGRRSRYRHARLPPSRRRELDVLRDRSRGDPDREQSNPFHVPVALRAEGQPRARRCASHTACLT